MKKLIILTVFMGSLTLSHLAHAEWTLVANSVSGASLYVDLDRLRKSDGKIYFWELTNYDRLSPQGYLSDKAYIMAECGPFRKKTLTLSFYQKKMARGSQPYEIKEPTKNWYYPSPNSMGEKGLNVVCNHKP